MPIALDPKATFTYVLEDDRKLPDEDQTSFTLRGLTVAEEAKVADVPVLHHDLFTNGIVYDFNN